MQAMIDWTLPVETSETPPRPVRVLATDFKSKGFPYLCAVDYGDYEAHAIFSAEGWDTQRVVRLRNVAPKPVRREETIKELIRWRAKANETLKLLKERNDAYEVLLRRVEALQAEVGGWRNTKIDHMKPVVDAAVAWVLPELRGSYAGDTQRLIDAVRTYQSKQPATSDSHEAMVDAEECEHQPYVPIKNCTTCRWQEAQSVCGAKDCLGKSQNYRGWEKKDD